MADSGTVAVQSVAERLAIGLRKDVSYPITIQYCGNCTMPIEVSYLLFV